MDLLKRRFMETFTPTQHLSLDESLLKWYGNLGWKVYIPAKRSRYGMKVYKLCCDQYTLNFRLYFGKEDVAVNIDNALVGKMEKLVLNLMGKYRSKDYILYTDRLYTTPLLCNELWRQGIGVCGTAMMNKACFPRQLKNSVMAKRSRETEAVRNGPVLALKYADKKSVNIPSTVHDHSLQRVTAKAKGEGIVTVEKPKAIIAYNQNMGGVDRTDQIINSYKSARKTMKGTKKLVLYMMQHGTLNAHYLYAYQGGSLTYMQFMLEVLHEILDNRDQLQPSINQTDDNAVRLTQRHFIYRIPSTDTRKYPSKKCRVCTTYKTGESTKKETTFFCPECPTQPALCPGDCFKIYHTCEDYKK